MKILQLFIICLFLFSCKKENIYYYSNNKQIKDSTVIRFVDEELEKLNIKTVDKNLKIFTTLDSTSYKSNLDSIRNKIFEKSLHYNLKPEDKKAFDEWFREKVIVVDNKSGKVLNYYSSFKNKKYDRNLVNLIGLRKLIKVGTWLGEYPEIQIPKSYMSNYGFHVYREEDYKLQESEQKLLKKLNITDFQSNDYRHNDINFLEVLTVFQAFNNKNFTQPFIVDKILQKDKIIYSQKNTQLNIFTQKSFDKLQEYLPTYKKDIYSKYEDTLKETKNLILFGSISDTYFIIYDKKFTYLIYNSTAIVTDLKKRKYKVIDSGYNWKRAVGIKYYNAIRK
ncbi:hypothetical protein [Chryseobacterium sp.]|uniref:hypothetical protein n=1 Tax=Chryseobacterium sp. TaxID=1871047 RepID=UPI00289EBE67|nr:hypothetical protein [Chryseobacterium sp.]